MSQWGSHKAKRVLAALQRIGCRPVRGREETFDQG